jgi:hypothetical protein
MDLHGFDELGNQEQKALIREDVKSVAVFEV